MRLFPFDLGRERPPERPIDQRLVLSGRAVRFTNRLDPETAAFEDALLALPAPAQESDPGDPAPAATTLELPLHQRHAWLRHVRREFVLMQSRDPAGGPAMQAAVFVHRSRPPLRIAHGFATRLGPAKNGEEELAGLDLLRQLCREHTDLLTLRLQPRRPRARDLRDFEDRARLCGYLLSEPEGITRTPLYDLRPEPEASLLSMGQQLRRKIKARTKHEVELRVLDDARYAGACQEASRAAVGRTGGESRLMEWETLFTVARERPDLLRVMGLFLRDRPDQLLAFASACRHGTVAEYTSAGSRTDPELRRLPFNYWLLWELFLWARGHGSLAMDLGGVTVGGPGDPLGGVSRFKRHLTEREIETGREMVATLRPARAWAVATLRTLRDVAYHQARSTSAISDEVQVRRPAPIAAGENE